MIIKSPCIRMEVDLPPSTSSSTMSGEQRIHTIPTAATPVTFDGRPARASHHQASRFQPTPPRPGAGGRADRRPYALARRGPSREAPARRPLERLRCAPRLRPHRWSGLFPSSPPGRAPSERARCASSPTRRRTSTGSRCAPSSTGSRAYGRSSHTSEAEAGSAGTGGGGASGIQRRRDRRDAAKAWAQPNSTEAWGDVSRDNGATRERGGRRAEEESRQRRGRGRDDGTARDRGGR